MDVYFFSEHDHIIASEHAERMDLSFGNFYLTLDQSDKMAAQKPPLKNKRPTAGSLHSVHCLHFCEYCFAYFLGNFVISQMFLLYLLI